METSKQYSIVIADDNPIEQKILSALLHKANHTVHIASDGCQALELFKVTKPDIVILDALMPNMDGFETAKHIRHLAGERFVPILFITALDDPHDLIKCLEHGDDVFTKPFDQAMLTAKLAVAGRFIELYSNIQKQRDELDAHKEQLETEQLIAKKVFDSVAQIEDFEHPNIHYIFSSMSTFNGDLLLIAKREDNNYNIMLGDFTGHGLPAAIGILPVSDIFYTQTKEGRPLVEIIQNINKKITKILPTGFFCCSGFIETDFVNSKIKLWNYGLPEAIVYHGEHKQHEVLNSQFMPLGIVDDPIYGTNPYEVDFSGDNKVYLFSDGIVELENAEGDLFGIENVVECLRGKPNTKSFVDDIKQRAAAFRGAHEQTDDVTLIEITAS